MAKTTLTKTSSIVVGDVLFYEDYSGQLRAARVDDYSWLTVGGDGVRTKVFAVQFGEVKKNEFLPREDDQEFLTERKLRDYGFKFFWTPDRGFKDGQFLKDQNNVVYFHKDSSTVWRTLDPSNGQGSTWASLASWRNRGVQFSPLETIAGKSFEDIVSGKVSF